MPLFSVVIPTYNRRALLENALQSVWNQTFTDYEVIVVDDGSTDGTREYLTSLAGVTVLTQENRGPGAARNLAIRQAEGRYIAFLDSDDLWFPWTLRLYSDTLNEFGEPAFIAGSDFKFINPADPIACVPQPTRVRCYANYFSSSADRIWIGTCAVAVRTDVLRGVGGFTSAAVNAEDSDLWLRLGLAPGFVQILEPPVFAYRQTPGSASRDFELTYRGTVALVDSELASRYPGGRRWRVRRWQILTGHLRPVSVESLRRGRIDGALYLFQRSLGWHLRLGRVRYLLAFLLLLAGAFLRRVVHSKRDRSTSVECNGSGSLHGNVGESRS
jgi:hypothetical protein